MAYVERNYLIEQFEMLLHDDNVMCPVMKVLDALEIIDTAPTADVVEVRAEYNVGDFCLYGFVDGNKSLAIVEIVKILDDIRGIAEVKFHKVIKDNTGNGFFHYLFKSGGTMNASFKYLKNITPRVEGEK